MAIKLHKKTIILLEGRVLLLNRLGSVVMVEVVQMHAIASALPPHF